MYDSGIPKKGFLAKIQSLLDACFGSAALVVGLAFVSAIPLLNLLSLGYLLEASGRVARLGKFRYGFIGVFAAAIWGKIILAVWVLLLPLRLLYSHWTDLELIAEGSDEANKAKTVFILVSALVVFHIIWSLIRGGKLRHFLWPAPLRLFRWLGESKDFRGTWNSLLTMFQNWRLPYFFWLGLRGFVGAFIWLALPVLILIGASQIPNPGISFLVSAIGGLLLGVAVLYIPFLQTRFALTGDFQEFLGFRKGRQAFQRAPLAFWLALFATLLFAIPLYALKIELAPREIFWLSNIVFVIFIFPARLLVGWAVSRSNRRDLPRIWVSRWLAGLIATPVVVGYVFIVWLTQYLSWHGSLGILEQHAFLVPAPLFGL